MAAARTFRWGRFIDPLSRTGVIVPLDHGLTAGPLAGVEAMGQVRPWIGHAAINGVVLHKGYAERLFQDACLRGKGICIHLNGTSSLSVEPTRKIVLTSVEAAVRLAADAVSIDLVFDGATDAQNLRLVGQTADQASYYELPLLVMVKSAHPVSSAADRIRIIRQLVRSMAELNVTAVKLARVGVGELAGLLEHVAEDVDIFFAGGERESEATILEFAAEAISLGARGLCIGRNVFQHPSPGAFLDRIRNVVNGGIARLDRVSCPA